MHESGYTDDEKDLINISQYSMKFSTKQCIRILYVILPVFTYIIIIM